MSASILVLYLSVSCCIGSALLLSFFTDASTSKLDATSWLVVLIASTLWVVVLPLSVIEKLMQWGLLDRNFLSPLHSNSR